MKLFVASALIILCYQALFGHSSRIASPWQVYPPHDKPSEPVKYVVTFPAYFRTSKDFTFNVILFQADGYSLPISFSATLTDGDKTIAQQDFTQSAYGLQQHAFSKLSSAPATIQQPAVSIKFNGAEMAKYQDISGEPSRLAEQFVFIQTDKAMYKPTQTVNFRVLALNRELAPLSGRVSVTILDAKKNRIRMWDNQRLERGLFGSSFTLSDFVNFGEWTVSVKADNSSSATEKPFTVQQYVLPKYEAKLEFPKNYLLYSVNESSYKGYVRAKYTFGKNIRGKAVVAIVQGCYIYRTYHYRPIVDERWQREPLIVKNVTLKGDGSPDDGMFTLEGLNRALFSSSLGNKMSRPSCSLEFKVNVTEELTGEVVSLESENVHLYRDPYILKLHDSVAKTIKPGLPFHMRIQVSRPDGSPIDEQVNVVTFYHSMEQQSGCNYGGLTDRTPDNYVILSSDKSGIVSAIVNVPTNADTIVFKAFIRDAPETEICESRRVPRTRSNQAVSISIDRPLAQSNVIPKVGDSLKVQVKTTFATDYVYFIMAQNGQPFIYKKLDRPVEKTSTGTTFYEEVTLPNEAAPRASAVAWTVENVAHEVIADALEFKVDGLVRQQVTASFNPTVVAPGGSTTLSVRTSEPGSTVAMFAVDKSVKLLRSGNDITVDDVVGTVSSQQSYNHRPVSPVMWRCWRCGWWPFWVDSSSADQVFRGVGMVIKSNAHTDSKPIMPEYVHYLMDDGAPMPMMMAASARGDAQGPVPVAAPAGRMVMRNKANNEALSVEQPPPVRMLFPETWFWWTNTSSSSSNDISQEIKAPDTITSWVLSALAVGENSGFGALDPNKPVELTVFQPFFVNLDIPYATVIRNEQFAIKAVVFNYQATPQEIKLTLKKSPQFEISTNGGNTYQSEALVTTVFVPANDGQSVSLWLKPRQLGEIVLELEGVATAPLENGQFSADAMQKKITVEPEGETRYANRPIFLRRDYDNGIPFNTTINVDEMFGKVARSQVVDGSRFFQLQAIGDLLGPALTQLGSQIRLPTGCGEQTMVILAPNVYIYKYLKTVNELTPDLEAKTTNFVLQGYQRELTYQRQDGGFSAFGDNDPASSTWLTAFVMRCFNAASKHVNTPIDQNIVERSWQFLKSNADLASGTFKDPGRVIHLAMKGGATSDLNLAAYIYLTFAEAGGDLKFAWPSVAKTRELLETKAKDESIGDAYQLSLIAYATSLLPGDRDISIATLDRLLSMAIRDANFIFWNSSTPGQSQIETAAYVLLALCSHGHLDDASGVARWLMSQRNSLGGFASTQDTVVGLQALAEFASKLTGIEKNMKITAQMNFADNGRPFITEFFIYPGKEMLLQSFDLSRSRQALRSVDISVSGTGVALVQLALRYNILAERVMDSGDFDIKIIESYNARKKRSTTDVGESSVSLYSCINANSEQAKVGMVVAEIGIPTGFTADLEATKRSNKISQESLLKRIEAGDRKLVYYFDSLTGKDANSVSSGATCIISRLLRGSEVKNAQRPVARVYSYYEPSRTKSILYSFDSMNLSPVETAVQDTAAATTTVGPSTPSQRRGWFWEGFLNTVSVLNAVLRRVFMKINDNN